MAASTAESGLGNALSLGTDSPLAGTPLQSAATSLFSSGTEATATAAKSSGKGVGKHYWTVTLTPPAGASAALKSFVKLAETAIQTAVDLLGRGTPELPPKVDDLLQPQIFESLGEGEASKEYRKAVDMVQKRQKSLLEVDDEVVQASLDVANGAADTLTAIKHIVNELKGKLKAVGSGKLKAAQEEALMWHISEAVEAVYKLVDAQATVNDAVAGGSKGSQGSGGQAGGAQGGGGGGLESLLPMLAMIPMGLASLAPPVMDALKKEQEKHEEQGKADQAGAPPGTPGAPPADPNAVGAPGAAPAAAPPGQPVANTGAPAQAQPADAKNAAGATALPNVKAPLQARRDRPASNTQQTGGQATDEQKEAEDGHEPGTLTVETGTVT
ncbi:hypothetical protein BJY24_007668 [Nocardia transvalensis]|uniref:Uncharacterized protein n=1 Tax=Nocardia transvalensis TaxID=37333 RepID=A0A7W9PME4_9NOCA|nr:hypothetical protein [Nocardia transvalensis]MBB5918756.1 hypothetical protein [Nocardia transvalensis]